MNDEIYEALQAQGALFNARRLLQKLGIDPAVLKEAQAELDKILDRVLEGETK